MWRRRTNTEVFELYGQLSIPYAVRVQRTRWLGHLVRLPEGRMAKEALDGKAEKERWDLQSENGWRRYAI